MITCKGILFFTDFHAHLWSEFANPVSDPKLVNDRFAQQVYVLDKALSLAQKEDLLVIHGGDLFHTRGSVDTRVVNAVFGVFAKHAQVPTILLRGNHDSVTNQMGSPASIDIFNALPNAKVISNPEELDILVDNEKIYLSFMPYGEEIDSMKATFAKQAELAKASDAKVKIEVAHLGIDGAKQGLSTHRLASAFSLGDLYPDSYDAVYLGHFHDRQVLQYKDTDMATGSNGRSISKNTVDAIKYSVENGLVSYDYDKGIVYYGESKYVGSPDAQGYYAGHIKTPAGKDFKVRNHLIIGYLKFGYDMVGNTIDHVNNKHGINDNYPENLEVLSHYENNVKDKDTTDCKALNVNTSKVVYAHSEGDLARKIGTTSGPVHSALTKQDSHKTGDYLVQYVGYDFDRAYLNHKHGEVVVDRKELKTGEVKTYATVSSAISDNHIADATARNMLAQDNWHEVIPGFLFKRHTPENKPMPNDRFPMEHQVWYGGSTMQLTFNDQEQEKGFDKFTLVNGKPNWEFIKADYKPFITLNHWTEEDAKKYKDYYVRLQLPEKLAKALPQAEPNIRLEAKVDTTEKARMDIKSDTSPFKVTEQFTSQYYPDLTKMATDVIMDALGGEHDKA